MSPPFEAPSGSVVASVTGSDAVRARFADLSSRTRRAAEALVQDLAEQLASAVRAAAPKKSGRLERSIKALRTKTMKSTGRLAHSPYLEADTVRYVVRPRVGVTRGQKRTDYGYAVEFGQLPVTKSVKAYSRRYRPADVRGWAENKHGRRRRKIIAHGTQMVEGYKARQTMKPRPFLGPTFERSRSQIEAALQRGLEAIVARTSGGTDAPGTGRGGPA